MAGAARHPFDVYLRVVQVAAIQTGFYSALSVIVALICSIWGLTPTLAFMFSSSSLDFSYSTGWAPAAAYLIVCLPLTIAIYLNANRAPECLDFAATVYALHLIAVISYMGRVPTELAWWIIVLASVIVVSVGSEVLCLRREAGRKPSSHRDSIALSEIVAN